MSKIDWFEEARYGLFVHWGPYSVAARGEWVVNRELIPKEEYTRLYVDTFTADKYDPAEWAQLAIDAGMKYAVLTAKHHDGFCLWDTKTTDFNAVRRGPKRDLVRPYVEAFRAVGLKVGLYFSVADWFSPHYPTPFARDWPKAWTSDDANQKFIAFYRSQLEELLTQFGRIDLLWYDGAIPAPMGGKETNERMYALQPHILINERLGDPCDFRNAEQVIKPKPGPWESCMTLNDNWGYHAGDHAWKQPADVIQMILKTAGAGGNLLLNVGPRGDGTIPEASVKILREAGAWLKKNNAFLSNSGRSPFAWNNSSMLTIKEGKLYVHLFKSPGSRYCLAEFETKVKSARYLETGLPAKFSQQGPRLFFEDLPPIGPIATTIELTMDGPVVPLRERETFWIPE